MKRIVAALAIALAAVGIAGGAAQASPVRPAAHARTMHFASVTIGSGWSQVYLHAYSGGGCAWYGAEEAGGIFYSQPCGAEQEEVDARITTAGYLEIALEDAGLALTISGGEWKWETANGNTTVFNFTDGPYTVGGNDYYVLYNAVDTSHFMGPNGEGAMLKDITPTGTLEDAGWTMLSS